MTSERPSKGTRNSAPERRPPSRSELRNQAIREQLEPLAPGERPRAVMIAAVLAVLMAVANLVAWVLSDDREGTATVQSLSVTAVLLVAASGMWHSKYWAVMGFQTLLALQAIVASLALVGAGSAVHALILLAIVAVTGSMFWFLVRALARIQIPVPPQRKTEEDR